MTDLERRLTDESGAGRSRADDDAVARMRERVAESGLRRVHVLTWRDLEHPWAGGSELHINQVARWWTRAGLEVTIRTGAVEGGAPVLVRDGYRVVREGSRTSVLFHAPAAARRHDLGPHDALVEVWHGINFMTPLWARGPRVGIVHHVHGPQFHEVLPRGASDLAMALERRVYPRLYRRERLVAVSASTRASMLALGYDADRITVIENGVDDRFRRGGEKSATPSILAVARLMPQKRVPYLIDILAEVRRRVPTMRAVIVGDGPARPSVDATVARLGDPTWLTLEGRVSDERLLSLYQQAWVLASASSAEGWGLTLTEGAACGTPCVASRIPGHQDAVFEGRSGLLADDADEFADHLVHVLTDHDARSRLTSGALDRVRSLRWPQTAAQILDVVIDEYRATRA